MLMMWIVILNLYRFLCFFRDIILRVFRKKNSMFKYFNIDFIIYEYKEEEVKGGEEEKLW